MRFLSALAGIGLACLAATRSTGDPLPPEKLRASPEGDVVPAKPSPAEASPLEAPLAWERAVGGNVIALDVSPDARCVAATTTSGFSLLDAEGRILWERPYMNQWMAAASARSDGHALTVAPGCRWLVVAGSPDYRYIWILDGRGRPRAHFATPGTPQAIAISHRGGQLAVGTAAGHLLFADSRGRVTRDVVLGNVVLDTIEYSPDDDLVLTSTAIGKVGLFTRAGDVVWTRPGPFMRVWASDDWQRFVVQSEPMHGFPIGSVEIVARDGSALWHIDTILAPTVRMSPDGGRFAIASAPREEGEVLDAEFASMEVKPIVIERDGTVLPEGSTTGEDLPPADSASRCVLEGYAKPLVCRDRNGRVLWQVSGFRGFGPSSHSSDLRFIAAARDTGAGGVVLGYRAPGTGDTAAADESRR